MNKWIFYLLIALDAALARAHGFPAEPVLLDWPVHAEGDQSVFATRFDYRNGMLFVAHVEPGNKGDDSDLNLRTVVQKGTRQTDGSWHWERIVLDNTTLLDPWHTQASVGLDKKGHLHVAYNMHNMPWQYMVSRKPYDISSFEFRGQAITKAHRVAVKRHNRTPFPTQGGAAIPGNQITYPMFFSDRHGELFISYRFAMRPANAWEARSFAGAIARYDIESEKWLPIGGEISVSAADVAQIGAPVIQRPFAYQEGYSVYLLSLAFDDANGMHVFWTWRAGGAGIDTSMPSYAYSPDGQNFQRLDGRSIKLPASIRVVTEITGSSDPTSFYAAKAVAAGAQGRAIVVLHPIGGIRSIWNVDGGVGVVTSEFAPDGASSIVVDSAGREWAFASGVRVFVRNMGDESWKYAGQIGDGLCSPSARYFPNEARIILYAKSCETKSISVFTFIQ